MKKIFLTTSIIILLILSYNFIANDFNNERFYKKLVPVQVKEFLKKTIFKRSLENQKLKDKIIALEIERDKIKENNLNLSLKLREEIFRKKRISFELENKKTVMSKENENYEVTLYITDDLFIGKNPARNPKASAYLDLYDNKLFLASGDGIISFLDNYSNKSQSLLSFKIINSNLENLVDKKDFFSSSYNGVKDLEIFQDKIFLSYSDKLDIDKKCHILSVAQAKINVEFLNFKKIFSTKACGIRSDAKNLNGLYSQGGRLQIDNNFLYLTIGTFGSELQAQKDSNYLGKIIRLSLNDENYIPEVLSKGHRNPQGMFLNTREKFLYLTEHGPNGGDEINFLDLQSKSRPSNYGWPISSYGEHVIGGKSLKDVKEMYETMPLHKSHKEFNFIEPIFHFKKSAAISQIIQTESEKENLDNLYVGTLGRENMENQLELHNFKVERKTKKVVYHDRVKINNRVRDLDYDVDNKTMILFLETKGQIAFIKKK